MDSTVEGRGGEVMYDQRLFNQDKGIAYGFATDDQYNVYDRGLFNAQPIFSTLYKPKKDMNGETYGGVDEQLDKIMKTDRFKPDKGFVGAESSGPRDGPVEFEKVIKEDAFWLDMFLNGYDPFLNVFDREPGFLHLFPKTRNYVCMAIGPTRAEFKVGQTSVFGARQQQNFQLLYNLRNITLAFRPTNCSKY